MALRRLGRYRVVTRGRRLGHSAEARHLADTRFAATPSAAGRRAQDHVVGRSRIVGAGDVVLGIKLAIGRSGASPLPEINGLDVVHRLSLAF